MKLAINEIDQKIKKLAECFKTIVKNVKKVYQNEIYFLFLNKTVNEEITLLNSNASWNKLLTKHFLLNYKIWVFDSIKLTIIFLFIKVKERESKQKTIFLIKNNNQQNNLNKNEKV